MRNAEHRLIRSVLLTPSLPGLGGYTSRIKFRKVLRIEVQVQRSSKLFKLWDGGGAGNGGNDGRLRQQPRDRNLRIARTMLLGDLIHR